MPSTTARRRSRAFSLPEYETEVEVFSGEVAEEQHANLAGHQPSMDLAGIYARHAGLFERAAVDALAGLARSGTDAPRARLLHAAAVEGHLEQGVADLSDAITEAESTAIVMWRGQPITYRQVPIRVAEATDRGERNVLDASYRRATEEMNPLREARWTRLHAAAVDLGYANYLALAGATGGFDPLELAADVEVFLRESETLYYAGLRRYLALIGIESGDASVADLQHLLRGRGWDPYFPAAGLLAALRSTLAGLGIDLDTQPGIDLDLDSRPGKSPRAFCAPVRIPGDVRLVIQPRGGHQDYDSALHELGHLEHFAHVSADLAVPYRYLGDISVTEGYAFLFQYLIHEPEWLAVELGMPVGEIGGFLDFAAFRKLFFLRRYAAKLLYEVRLHQGGDPGLQRAYYAGLLGLLTGVSTPDASYLADVDDNLYTGKYLRAWFFEGSLSAALKDRFGRTWWRDPQAGVALREMWAAGQQRDADALVASLGYDRLDWRPVFRQIRAALIGEMSGYGGPNITTRAGTRKI